MARIRKLFSLVVVLSSLMLFSFSAKAEEIDNRKNQYTIPEGTVYWESSQGMGTGKHNTVSQKNLYTKTNEEGDLDVRVNGFSLLDIFGNVVESHFSNDCENFEIPEDEEAYNLMFHVTTTDAAGGYRLGWVKETDVFLADETKYEIKPITEEDVSVFYTERQKEAKKIAETLQDEIEKDKEIPRESVIVADFSGSMYSFQENVLNRLNDMSGKKYVFGEDIVEYSPDEGEWQYAIGGGTDIMNSLNKTVTAGNSHIYLLTDLGDNCENNIEQNLDFRGVITIVYYPGYDKASVRGVYEVISNAYPNARVEGF